jgi:hypothetical protein
MDGPHAATSACTKLRAVVEGISELGEGVLLGERYRLAHRIELFADGAERVAGVEFEYWAAQDVASGDQVWVQFAAADGVYAGGGALAGAVAALRRINHPAVPAVRAFGEYEFELEDAVAAVGYCAIPAAAGQTLAAAVLREELDQAEILAALAQVSEVLELLAEFELVHGHLSAHSVLLSATEDAGYTVLLADLPVSLALETALESELTAAADVYALAWLTVLALVGPAALEAEFGSGFAVTTEIDLLAEQIVRRRRVWAEENLVALGFSAELAGVLVLALGEAGARPRAAGLTAALRAEWMLYAEGGGPAEIAAVEAAGAVAAAEVAAAAEVEVAAEAAEAEVQDEAVLAAAAAAEVAEQESVGAAAGESAAGAAGLGSGAAAVAAGAAETALLAEAVGVLGGAGAASSGAAAAAGSGSASGAAGAGAVTEVIPRTPGGSGTGRAPGTRAASPSGPVGGSGGSGGSGGHHRPRRPRPGVLLGAGVGVAIVIVLIIVLSTGGSKGGSPTASSGLASPGASASASAGATGSPAAAASGGAGATTGAGSGGGATATATGGALAGASAAASPGVSFPSTLATVPASPSQAVQQIQAAATKAQGELSGAEQGQLNQIVGTLNQEISSGQSISTGVAQLWALLHSGELPSSLNTYVGLLASYLSASQGS